MKRQFYHLGSPGPGKPHQIYGHSAWERNFGRAEWSEKAAGFGTGRFFKPFGYPRKDLAIVLPTPKVGDFVWTWYSDCLVPDKTLSLFEKAGVTGFGTRPVIIEKIWGVSAKRRKKAPIPPLWELLIRGKGGNAAPESGIVPYQYEDSSGVVHDAYTSFRNGIIVEESNWDGSDFFTVNGYPKFLLISEQVKELIIDRQLTNCALIPSNKLEWSGFRGEDQLEEERAMAARSLESLLEDLEDPSAAMKIIFALGEKGDPRAVDALIDRFHNPDPLIWHSAASSVASIAKHKKTPEQTREEIFSRLCVLLGHDDPLGRKSAALALSFIGTEQAAREVMRLLDDPHESVRRTGAFVMGSLSYKPALEALRGLTRDRSKLVREIARRVVRDPESEFP